MAVGVEDSILSKTGRWNSALSSVTPSGVSEPMTAIMSYQYPLPPAPDVEVSPSNLVNNYHLPTLPSPNISQPLHGISPSVRRGTSGPSKPGRMKRSSSSPNVRGQARGDQTESAFISLADEKRRNKLGYHRTSVACGHCRRRKIRCIPAAGDAQNRCANCIRLKKECHFHPVDQQAEHGSGRRDSQLQGAINGRTSSSSSPPNGPGQISEMHNTLPYPHLSIPPIHDLGTSQMKRPRTDSFSSDNKTPIASRASEYGPPSAGWVPNEPGSVGKNPSEISSSYWRMNNHDSPMTPAFSPFTPNMQNHSNWSHGTTEPSPREELGWSVPQRSMSYSNHDALHHSSSFSNFHQNPPDTHTRDDFVPRQPPHQPEIFASNLTPTSTSASTAEASLSATSVDTIPHATGPPPLPPPFPNGQGWQPYTYKAPALQSNEGYQGWYGQNSALPSHPHAGEPMPPPSFGHVESYNGMYYPGGTQGGR